MIDYFTHFIYIQFHLFRRNDAAAVNHRADFADKRTDFLRIHSLNYRGYSREVAVAAAREMDVVNGVVIVNVKVDAP